jgi:general secretion pathway protein B
MSYILDALRRADSERERGAVPSIHSPPVPPVVDDPRPARAQPQAVLVGVIVVLLLALAGLLAWHLMGGGGKEAPAQPAVATAPLAQEPPPATPPQMAPAQATQPAPLQMQAPALQSAPAPRPQPPAATMPPPMVAPAMASAAPPRPAQPTPSPSLATAPPVVTVPARPAAAPQADTRVYAVHELPANIQRDLPKLVVGGAMYSDTPANRMLIINSQVFREGDKLSADLLLQEIRLKSAVFQYKGYRYGVSY